ncbi:MAG: tRNA pseudouridine(38-40) synthase TruA [Caedibacter sp. 37-49]|nr:MAG: tRNA pseudouridine(38-40) synthase TruA [Caedibacter sp. 37-49]
MTRYKLTVEYDGTPFVGWQHQANGMSVQMALETAIEAFSQEKVRVHAAGRTDAGVHALGQVAHFDLEKMFPAYKVREALNYYLRPYPIAILEVQETNEQFHARFSALERFYCYKILCRSAPPALDKKRVWYVKQPLNIEMMQQAANVLIGKHDFTTFRASECQASSPVRTLNSFEITQENDLIFFKVCALSFLHHQVRNMVGSLKLVGENRWTPEDFKKALEAKSRASGGPTAPPEGLYFIQVRY